MDIVYSNYAPTFLYVDRYHFASTWVYQPSKVHYSLLRYIVKGSALFRLGEEEYRVKEGDVFYIPQESLLSCEALTEIIFISVRFVGSIQLPGTDMLRHLWGVPQQTPFGHKPEMYHWFESMYLSAVSRNTYKMLEIRGYLNLICAALASAIAANAGADETLEEDRKRMEAGFDPESLRRRAEKSTDSMDPRIRVVVDYIVTHPGENLTREDMCQMAEMSESTLRRLFKAHTKKTIHEFIKETKMLNAARMLVVTSEPITNIGYELGYESASYFGKCFREVFGVSPQRYRKMSQNT